MASAIYNHMGVSILHWIFFRTFSCFHWEINEGPFLPYQQIKMLVGLKILMWKLTGTDGLMAVQLTVTVFLAVKKWIVMTHQDTIKSHYG